MADQERITRWIMQSEGSEELLYSDESNPYESVCIRARIFGGALTVIDSECSHGPDGGWSHRILSFDRSGTEQVFDFLLDMLPSPFAALKRLVGYNDRTQRFAEECEKRGIAFESRWSF